MSEAEEHTLQNVTAEEHTLRNAVSTAADSHVGGVGTHGEGAAACDDNAAVQFRGGMQTRGRDVFDRANLRGRCGRCIDSMPAYGVRLSDLSSLALPAGWEVAFDDDNDPYYVDHNSRQTYRDPGILVRMGVMPERMLVPIETPQLRRGTQRGGQQPRGGQGTGIDTRYRHTQMFRYITSGPCPYGDHCAFAHTADELRAGLEAARGLHHDGNGTSA